MEGEDCQNNGAPNEQSAKPPAGDMPTEDALDHVIPTAQLRIQMARHPSLRLLTCEHRDGVLVIEGAVPTFHHKQLAQETMRDIPGVAQIKNMVKVVPQEKKP
jgi:hypothetical protein